jgi:hypothetical protein
VLVDPSDMGLTPKVMFIIDHSVKEGADPTHVVSRRMQFVEIDPKGNAINAGWAPHLDLEPLAPADMALIEDVLAAPWIAKDLEQVALAHASTHLVPEHFDEVRARREKTSTRRWPPSTSAWSRKSTSGPTATSSCRTTSPPARTCA